LILPCVTALLLASSQPVRGVASAPDDAGASPAYIGVLVATTVADDWTANRLCSTNPGVRVVGVDHGSPAMAARLREGDVILSANAEPLAGPVDLDGVLAGLRSGDRVTLSVRREGKDLDLALEATELPRGFVGFDVIPLREALSDTARSPARVREQEWFTAHGSEPAALDSVPIVNWVHTDIPELRAARFDVRDAIVTVGGDEVRSVSELRRRLRSVRVGDPVDIGYRSYASAGELRNVCYAAQGPAEPWSGLNLEKITPLLVEIESLPVSGVEEGLYVRSYEAPSVPSLAEEKETRIALRFGLPRYSFSLSFWWGPDDDLKGAGRGGASVGADVTGVGSPLLPVVRLALNGALEAGGEQGVEAPALSQRGPRPGEILTSLDGEPIDSTGAFDAVFNGLRPGEKARATIRGPIGAIERAWYIERRVRVPALRPEPTQRGRGLRYVPDYVVGSLEWQPSDDARRGMMVLSPLWGLPGPFPLDYTKVDAIWLASSSLRWSALTEEPGSTSAGGSRRWADVWSADLEWGLTAERAWLYGVTLSAAPALVPHLSYRDGPMPFRGQRTSNSGETLFSMLIGGVDPRDYVWQEGWIARWSVRPRELRGHRISVALASILEEPIEEARGKSVFGERSYRPNVTEGVGTGRHRAVWIEYGYERLCPARLANLGIAAQVRSVGGALGGDFEFTRAEVRILNTTALGDSLVWENHVHAGVANGTVPRQDEFFLGGRITLPGYEDNRFFGDRVVMARTRLWLWPLQLLAGLRPFVAVSAGDAWRSSERSGISTLHADVELGIGELFFRSRPGRTSTLSVSVARSLDPDEDGEWRWHFVFFGDADFGGGR
jgi:S1-C subfamily serine protease